MLKLIVESQQRLADGKIATPRHNMAVHLIETSEEDSYLAVARYISDLLNEGEVSRRFCKH